MGYKRPFDAEELQELPFKQPRQVEYGNKLTQFSDSSSATAPPSKYKNIENNDALEESDLAKDFEKCVPLPWVSCEHSGFGASFLPSNSPEYIGSSIPRTAVASSGNVNISYLDDYPRKLVPVGPNHQARIPPWDTHVKHCKSENEERLMGSCIISMPDTTLPCDNNNVVGIGTTDCHCIDEGSVRCVRQHIMEAREKLKKSLGNEKFIDLGFYDMGEDVAYKWSDEEEHIFRSIVYSNPASLGYNFWNHLKPVFRNKTMKEIISYYFNVFMLRRRAAQNRSSLLEIDSDDDEVHGISKISNVVTYSEEDEDSGLESPVDGYEQLDQEEDIVEDDSDDDDDGDSSDGDVNVRDGTGHVTGEDSDIDNNAEALDVQSSDASKFGSATEQADEKLSSDGADFTVQDDSCLSYEFQTDKFEAYGHLDTDDGMQENGAKTVNGKYFPAKEDQYPDLGTQMYLTDVCDGKIWDGRYAGSPDAIKGFDLLPTSNIIEEIFGQESVDEKTKF